MRAKKKTIIMITFCLLCRLGDVILGIGGGLVGLGCASSAKLVFLTDGECCFRVATAFLAALAGRTVDASSFNSSTAPPPPPERLVPERPS